MKEITQEQDVQRIVEYIGEDYKKTPYLYVNTIKYGTGTKNVTCWIDEDNGQITGVYLQYFDCMHFYTRDTDKYPTQKALDFFEEHATKIIMVQGDFGDRIETSLEDSFVVEKNHIIDMDQVGSDKQNYTCEIATEEDIEEITDLLLTDAWYTEVYSREILFAQMLERYRDNFSRYFIIRLDGKIVASCSTAGETDSFALVISVIVHPEYRRMGLASAVENFACNLLKNENYASVGFVNYNNVPSLELHKKLGAFPTGSLYKFVRK